MIRDSTEGKGLGACEVLMRAKGCSKSRLSVRHVLSLIHIIACFLSTYLSECTDAPWMMGIKYL